MSPHPFHSLSQLPSNQICVVTGITLTVVPGSGWDPTGPPSHHRPAAPSAWNLFFVLPPGTSLCLVPPALPSYLPSPEYPLPHTSSIREGHSLPGGLSRPGVSVVSSAGDSSLECPFPHQGLSQNAAGNPGFTRLVPVTAESF